MRLFVFVTTGQRDAATVTDGPTDELHVTPACSTEAKVAFNNATTGKTSRRIDYRNRRLKSLI